MNADLTRTARADTGTDAELLACAYLQKCGLNLLARNFRSPRGEIDLIMQDGEFLVFVEVRYRRSDAFGSAAETVSAAKRARIVTTADYYLQRQPAEPPCRFDVIAVGGNAPHRIEWIQDAFQR